MDPSFTVIAGSLKSGKTSDLLSAFPGAIWVAAPGALAPAESVWGIDQPKAQDFETFLDIIKWVKSPAGQKELAAAPALAIDDASLIADRTISHLTSRGVGGFDLWGSIFNQCIMLRDALRRIGRHVAFTCHLAPPEVREGITYPGGPQFPGQTRVKLPAAADLLLRTERQEGLDVALGWPMCYRCGPPSAQWLQGSRYSTPDPAPANLREILNLAGFTIPRLRGLEWQEKVATSVAFALLATPGLGNPEYVKDTIRRARDACVTGGKKKEHYWWAIRDGYDRARLIIAKAKARDSMWGL